MRFTRFIILRGAWAGRFDVPLLALLGLLLIASAGAKPPKEGDVLRLFNDQRIFVITNDDPALAETLLDGCPVKQKRVITPDDWNALPENVRSIVTRVYLVNRERLPLGVFLPEKCVADGNEVFTQVSQARISRATIYEVTISAPDGTCLRRALTEFRRLAEIPSAPMKRTAPTLALIPVGAGAEEIARRSMAERVNTPFSCAHIVRPAEYVTVQGRLSATNELILIDRSAGNGGIEPSLPGLTADRAIGPTETAAWRFSKGDGRYRAVISAPNAEQLAEGVKRFPGFADLPETATTLLNARDLRSVRRIAVAGIKRGQATELARQLASQAAMQVRAMDAFEVVEREGLSQILGEVALGQAGITKAGDRVRVQRLAAADALLLVEVTSADGRTEYTATHKRLSPNMGPGPSKPQEPSRLKNTLGISDQTVLKVVEAVFSKNLGTKSDQDYKSECDRYRCEILPRWQRQMDVYQQERHNRPVTWEQKTTAHCDVRIKGSLRLVDLSDGLVLWEAPFAVSDTEDSLFRTDSITVIGEDNRPGPADVPEAASLIPDDLLERAASRGVQDGLAALRNTAVLPVAAPLAVPAAPINSPTVLTGKILDVDEETLLIGLGAGDGLKVGDALTITLESGVKIGVLITKVRPRTCDAAFDKSATPAQRTRVIAGQRVTRK